MSNYTPLSYVKLKGFGSAPVIAQITLDGKYIVLSTHYLLSMLYAIPELIHCEIGTTDQLIQKNKQLYESILARVIERNATDDKPRCALDDSLLVVRAFDFLVNKNFDEYTPELLDEALNHAISIDDMICSIHHNMAKAIAMH